MAALRLRRRVRPAAPRRRHRRGQSLVEMALVAPLLVVMLLGAAQVGSIAFGLVSVDSAAREGARAATLAPNATLESGGAVWYSTGTPSHQCNASDFTAGPTGNPACLAVLSSLGTLAQSTFTNNPCASAQQGCVTITVIPANGLQSFETGHPAARLENSSSCNNSNATVTGVVNLSGTPSGSTATVTATTGETQPTDTSGNFSICVKANGSTTSQTLTAQVGSVSCGGYSGSVGPFPVSGGGSYPENITVTAESACPTLTPTPTPTPTASPTPTPTAGPTPSPTSGPAVTCPPETVSDAGFIEVSVAYPSPVFVPFIGAVFQTQPGSRLITSTVTEAIEPCTLTEGA